jgi:hypothetical protein
VSSAPSSESANTCHVSGDVLATTGERLIAVLESVFGGDTVRVKSRQDVHVESPGLHLNFYTYHGSAAEQYDYLIGGHVQVSCQKAEAVCRRLAAALEAAHLVYSIELTDTSRPEQPTAVVIEHAAFRDLLRSRSARPES